MRGLTPEHCPACGYPIKKINVFLQEHWRKEINAKTKMKAIDFYKKQVRSGGWFEVKKIGRQNYLYGRMRQDYVKKSVYIGKV
jgi:hypothetical protein